ncbi:MAG TPA: hypothetical protein DCX78_01615, partial [Nitrospina sp.]|nr:hypothetical protein [Nitrospina sp.]
MSDGAVPNIEQLVEKNVDGGGSLDLENRELGDEGVAQLSGLEKISQITTLILGDNEISDKGVAALCESP